MNGWIQTRITHNNGVKIIAHAFDPIVLIGIGLIVSIYLWRKKEKEKSLMLIIVITTSALLLKIMKSFIAIERPINMLMDETSYAFPSGHSAMAAILLGMLIIIFYKRIKRKKLAIALSVLAALMIGMSRIFLNVHWVTDVVGGYLFGAFIIFNIINPS